MKKVVGLLTLLITLWMNLEAQQKSLVIPLKISKLTFPEFAAKLRTELKIYIYYEPEWVSKIEVSISGDSVNIGKLLDSLLVPQRINYFYRGNAQFFLTGSKKISGPEKFIVPNQDVTMPGASGQSVRQGYLGQNPYEQTVKKVVVGSKNQISGRCYLSGRISNQSNGEPVTGATVVVANTNTGVTSDGEGSYSLPLESGKIFNLTISCLGMQTELYLVEMNNSGTLNIEMKSKLIDVKEVVVRSDKFQNVKGLQMGFQSVGAKEMKSIPMVMGERDIFKVANLMPGVQTIGEGSAGFNVRGSASDQNLFLINEIPVLNTGHLFGFFSAFNPDMVNGLNLYKGNFPVEFGGRLASVFDITTRKGNKKEFGARGSISPVTGSILIETPIVKDKSSFMVSARSTYSNWILNRLNDAALYKRQGSFYDLMAGIHLLGKNRSSWQFFGYYSKDKFALSTTNDYRYENMGASATYDKRIGDKWTLKTSAVFSNYNNYQANREQASKAFDHQFSVRSQELKIRFTGYPAARHKSGFGANAILHNLNHGIMNPLGSQSLLFQTDFGAESGLEYALHAFDEFTVTDQLTWYVGLRYSFFNYLGPNTIKQYQNGLPLENANIMDTLSYASGKTIRHYSGPEYRTSLNYRLNPDFSIKLSYNKMRQYLFMLSNTASVAPTDRWKLVDPYVSPPVADQISFGIYKNFNNSSIETSAEVYYKTGKNVIEYKDNAELTYNPDIETLVLQGSQKAWGIEFLLKRNSGRLSGWVSYAYSRSLITVNGPAFWQKINQGITYPANYDKPHAVNFVANLKLSRRLSISSTVVYNTGRPITYPTGYFFVNELPVINYSLRNEYRIPDYFRTDVSFTIEGNLLKKKFAHGSWVFSVYNLTGRRNAYSIYFVQEDDAVKGYKLSIYGVPIFTISYQFKLGNYAVE